MSNTMIWLYIITFVAIIVIGFQLWQIKAELDQINVLISNLVYYILEKDKNKDIKIE